MHLWCVKCQKLRLWAAHGDDTNHVSCMACKTVVNRKIYTKRKEVIEKTKEFKTRVGCAG